MAERGSMDKTMRLGEPKQAGTRGHASNVIQEHYADR